MASPRSQIRRRPMKRTLLSLLFCWELQRLEAFVPFRPYAEQWLVPSSSLSPSKCKASCIGLRQSSEAHDAATNHDNNNHRQRYSNGDKSWRRRSRRGEKIIKMDKKQRSWLENATNDLIDRPPGSLEKGKWHELVSLIRAWSKHVKYDPTAPIIMEKLVKRMLDERKAGTSECKADIVIYNLLLDAWACAALFRTHGPIAAQRAREILVLLQESYELEQDPDLQPSMESFDIVFHSVCRTEGAHKARRVLAWMEFLYKVKRNAFAKPTRTHYIMLLDSYANSGDANAGHLAEGFLRHMDVTGEELDTLCYNIAIKAWTKAKRGRESAEHADQILEEMTAPKDIVTYTSVISAWAASGMRAHAIARVEELLRLIEETPGLEPNTVALNSVMSAWVKSRNPAAVGRTAELLDYMESSSKVPPDLISYNNHLHALSLDARREQNAQRAHDLLFSLDSRHEKGELHFCPNKFSYNLVIDAWARSRHQDADWNAVRVLRKLITSERADPDTFSFNSVLMTLSRSSKKNAPALAEELLRYMEESHRLKIHRKVKPDVVGYTSTILAWARSGREDAGERAEALLSRMKDHYAAGRLYMKPNLMTYNTVIDCWAKSRRGVVGARRAEALLKEMQELYASGDDSLSPNSVSYNAILNAWARSGTKGCGRYAEKYLDIMWKLYEEGDVQVKPNDTSFNTVINAISKSPNEAKAQKALRVLRRMDKLYQAGDKDVRPNEVTYTSVLNSCAFPAVTDERTRRKALDTAIFTLEELQASRYGQPNQITYGTFFKACRTLVPDDDELRRDVVGKAFQQCCEDGQVGTMVLVQFRNAAPKDLYQELLAGYLGPGARVTVESLPFEWRCNVGEMDRRDRKHNSKRFYRSTRGEKYSRGKELRP